MSSMAGITLVTGGAVSGKSRWAISYFRTCDNVLYMYTGTQLSAETRNRLEYSNNENNVRWEVMENVTDPVPYVKDHKFFILDNISSYVENLIRANVADISKISRDEIQKVRTKAVNSIIECMERVVSINGAMIIITTELGFSVEPDDLRLNTYRDIMGAVNQRIANTAADVYLSVSGIQFKIK